jgi:beta-phosphoglucomutase-like phosphatase (HAD superfamily)
MCDKCDEIDKKTEHYRSIAARITDQPLLDGIKELIERMQNQKRAFHPEQEK